MSAKIRLARMGKKRMPYYRIVVMDSRRTRDGQYLDRLGYYAPKEKNVEEISQVNLEKARSWLKKGAVPTLIVRQLFSEFKVYEDESLLKKPKKKNKRKSRNNPISERKEKKKIEIKAPKKSAKKDADKEATVATNAATETKNEAAKDKKVDENKESNTAKTEETVTAEAKVEEVASIKTSVDTTEAPESIG